MFSKKTNSQTKKPRRSKESRDQLVNMGLVPTDLDDFGVNNDSDNDEDLEDELQKLMFGGSKTAKQPKHKTIVPEAQLDSMVAACMQDIPSDAEDENDDDSDLLDELAQFEEDDEEVIIVPEPTKKQVTVPNIPKIETCDSECAGQSLISTIENRIESYAKAEKNAKANGESARARRFARGLASLTDLRKKIKSGKPIDENDIPPAISNASVSASSSNITSPKEDIAKPLPAKLEEIQVEPTRHKAVQQHPPSRSEIGMC